METEYRFTQQGDQYQLSLYKPYWLHAIAKTEMRSSVANIA